MSVESIENPLDKTITLLQLWSNFGSCPGKNVIIFWVDSSSSVHVNKKRRIS